MSDGDKAPIGSVGWGCYPMEGNTVVHVKLDFDQRKAALRLEGYCNQFPDEAAHAIIGLRWQKSVLLEAAEQAQCTCTIAERDSGHKVECWMPKLREAMTIIRSI